MVELDFLFFLAEPWFVAPWYAIGLIGAFWVAHDMRHANRYVKPSLKGSIPVIVFFFSVIGLAVYLRTARAPGIGRKRSEEAEKLHQEHVSRTFRKVTGSVIHCVGGDGLGIRTAMVCARLVGMTFWEEFWFEYAVGYLFGWFLFQTTAMTKMTDSLLRAIWMGGRAEFFSMLSVMAGMGTVMGFVTPLVVGEQPNPTTWGFWGFAALGLLLGYVLTYPMNWWLVKIGWKHGMG